MVYTCKICGAGSNVAPFYSGVTSRCKECHKRKVRENRLAKADYYRAYDAKRFQDDPRVKERHTRYQKSERGKASMLRAKKKWAAANQEKRAAHVILNNAVRDGRVMKPSCCDVCSEKHYRIHGHHGDYSKPLDVIWCCPQCHHDIHANQAAEIL